MARPTRQLAPGSGFWLTLLGGWFGLHRFARGQLGIGLVYLCTLGLFGIGWIVDSIIAGVNLTSA